jgi:tetratricopeptide (TPR) repeat protein
MIEAARMEELAGQRSEAIRWLEKAMLDPGQRQSAALYLSDLMLRQHDFERAVKLTKEASSRAPNDVKALFALSRAQLAAGDLAGARRSLGAMLSLAGFDPTDNIEMARLFLIAGDRDGAVHSVNKILRETPSYLPALAFLTQLDISGGNYAKAEQEARQIAERFPNRGVGLRLLASSRPPAVSTRRPCQASTRQWRRRRARDAAAPLPDLAPSRRARERAAASRAVVSRQS